MNIGIIGVGGVGGYFGGKICRSAPKQGANVYFVARGKHLDEIRKTGLSVITSAEGEFICHPTLATDCIEDLPELDVCLVCVKSYDLKNVILRLQRKISNATLVLPLLNGIDICERIKEDLTTGKLFPACAYVGTHIETYGKVVQFGGACKILLGKDPQAPDADPHPLFDLFDRSHVKYQWFDDVYPEIWAKYMFIAAFGLVTASFNKTLGQVMESSRMNDSVLSVMREILLLSQKKGIDLPETIIADAYQKGHGFPYDTKTSFQRDYECLDKPDERDLFAGTILRLGKMLGIETPVTQELSEVLNQKKPFPTR